MLRRLEDATLLQDHHQRRMDEAKIDVRRRARRLVDFRLLPRHLLLIPVAARIPALPNVQSGRARVEEIDLRKMIDVSSLLLDARTRVHHSVEHHLLIVREVKTTGGTVRRLVRHTLSDLTDEMAVKMTEEVIVRRLVVHHDHLDQQEEGSTDSQLTQSPRSRRGSTESRLRTCLMTWDGKS